MKNFAIYLFFFVLGGLFSVLIVNYIGEKNTQSTLKNTYGSRILDTEISKENGDTYLLKDVINSYKTSIIFFHTAQCTSCLNQVLVWKALNDTLDSEYRLYSVILDTDRNKTRQFLERADMSMPSYLTNQEQIKPLNPKRWPSIFIFTKLDSLIFTASGNEATSRLISFIKS